MLIYAGIDEAGYGPMLGPLCVACAAFSIPGHNPDEAGPCDLWKLLSRAVCRKRTDRKGRIAIDDSKKLKGPPEGPLHPLKHLERGVLSFCAAMPRADGRCNPDATADSYLPSTELPSTDSNLFTQLGVRPADRPWFGSCSELPVGQTIDELRIAAGRLHRTLTSLGISFELLRCEAIDAADFNRQVETMGNKSSVNFCAVLRHIDAVWQRWRDHHPRVLVDRLGGRTHYLQDLMLAWPDAGIQVLAESETLSRYRLERNGSRITISFQVECEQAHLPVALASMTAKYVRELFMLRLNRHFQAHMPELKATAGYTTDARRYLTDIKDVMETTGVQGRDFVRMV